MANIFNWKGPMIHSLNDQPILLSAHEDGYSGENIGEGYSMKNPARERKTWQDQEAFNSSPCGKRYLNKPDC
ncbi:MAG TPA: hypothetical protein VGK10_15690 [Prolixibacteraceae bacterium]|jgi:hypothetical protein